jgi:TonB family protein
MRALAVVVVMTVLSLLPASAYNAPRIPRILDYVGPQYDRGLPEGTGFFRLQVDPKSGRVLSASVAQSTGFAVLDQAALRALRRWRFYPGTDEKLVVPITFAQKRPPGRWREIPRKK